jgi:hypothetical protein
MKPPVSCQMCKEEPWTVFWDDTAVDEYDLEAACAGYLKRSGPKYLCQRCAEKEQWVPTRAYPVIHYAGLIVEREFKCHVVRGGVYEDD